MLQIWACQFRDQQNQFAKEIKTYELILKSSFCLKRRIFFRRSSSSQHNENFKVMGTLKFIKPNLKVCSI